MSIDRIVLSGVDLPPSRAERVRQMVRQHLQVALSGAHIDTDAIGADREHVHASSIRIQDGQSDIDLARDVAESLAEALYSQAGLPEGREHHG